MHIYTLLTLFISFVDRDMLMRYVGGAVGHKSTFEATKGLLASAKEAFGVVDDASVENHLLHEDPEDDDEEEEEGGYQLRGRGRGER